MNHYNTSDYVFVICAYGECQYLEECILSLRNQSIPISIIIATSTPNEYIAALADKYHLSVYVNSGPQGIAEDWNFGYQKANGRIVTIAHQDDIYEPHFAQRSLEKINYSKHPLISFSNYGEIRDANRVVSNRLLTIKRILLLPLCITLLQRVRFVRRRILSLGSAICCPSVTYVKENLPDTIFEPGYKCDLDWHAWERLSKLKGSFIYCSDILMFHRIHSESATTANILVQNRLKEDYEMFCKFWPKRIARLLRYFYRSGEKSNEI